MSGYINKVKLYTDGGCRHNPGPEAMAYRILDENDIDLDSGCESIGETTNNRAEYCALIKGLECAVKHTREVVNCYLDSELVNKQATGGSGGFRIRTPGLLPLVKEVGDNIGDSNV